MNRILFAYDGSPCAEAALEELPHSGLPARLDAMVLSVAEVWLPPGLSTPGNEAAIDIPLAVQRAREAAWQLVEQKSRRQAEHAAERLHALFPHWTVVPIAIGDSPAWGIVSQATRWGAELIVVGSHGRSMMRSFFLGSVSHKVAVEAPCSVHIARHRQNSGAQRILLAVDGSSAAMDAVRAVAARTWLPGAVFQLFTAIDPHLLPPPSWPVPPSEPWMRLDGAKGTEWVKRALDACAQPLRSAGLAVETHAIEGEPKQLLLKEASDWKADCIFLGAHGLRHERRSALGSVASAIATRAHCSVEVVRETPLPAEPTQPFTQASPP